ncbi:hypothetical protein AgCh_004026 [Apium graveolens]
MTSYISNYIDCSDASNDNPLGVKAIQRILATPNWQHGSKGKKVTAFREGPLSKPELTEVTKLQQHVSNC